MKRLTEFGLEVGSMTKIDDFELEVLSAFEIGKLKSVATKAERVNFEAAARATAIKDRWVTIRLSSRDLHDIQLMAADPTRPSAVHGKTTTR